MKRSWPSQQFLKPPRFLKKWLPQSFLGRSFLIILAPVVMIQLLSGYVFFDRHWDYITRILAQDIAGEVSVLATLLDKPMAPQAFEALQAMASQKLDFTLSPVAKPWESIRESKSAFQSFLKKALRQKLVNTPFKLYLDEDSICIWIKTQTGPFLAKTYTKRLFSRTTSLFLMWSLGSSLFFVMLALLFMRNQIRPLKHLAWFADQLGRGKMQEKFKSQGAIEIRKLAWTFHMMRLRLQKQVQERAHMLAGISHDLRTPLTRMKLQLALMSPSPEWMDFQKEVDHMIHLVESYLHFSKGHEAETPEPIHLQPFFSHLFSLLPPHDKQLEAQLPKHLKMMAQPRGLARCFTNLLENALRHAASKVTLTVKQKREAVWFWIDDDGPGIPEKYHKEVFKPFFRVDASRNDQTGGMGLGLSIVENLVKAHKGSIHLMVSPLGGLRVLLKIPILDRNKARRP
jgi:two-component system, OmpR family, osmolarity sensor histidine kinase EnvZ